MANGHRTTNTRSVATHTVESDLGRWTLTEWHPPAASPLARAIASVWDFEGMVALPRERVFPNGCVELLIQLDGSYRDVNEAGSVATPTICVTGVQTRAFVIEAPSRRCRVIGVRLRPPAAWALLGHPMTELADLTTDLERLLGRPVAELAERCHAMTTGAERVRRVVGWLAARLLDERAERIVDPSVRHVSRAIARNAGRVAIGPLRLETGLAPARLAELFRHQVGVTPKRYARIHRFRRALALLDRPDPRLSEIALSTGYYDQPHMNSEFRRMAGLTPTEFVKGRRFPSSTSLAEPART